MPVPDLNNSVLILKEMSREHGEQLISINFWLMPDKRNNLFQFIYFNYSGITKKLKNGTWIILLDAKINWIIVDHTQV